MGIPSELLSVAATGFHVVVGRGVARMPWTGIVLVLMVAVGRSVGAMASVAACGVAGASVVVVGVVARGGPVLLVVLVLDSKNMPSTGTPLPLSGNFTAVTVALPTGMSSPASTRSSTLPADSVEFSLIVILMLPHDTLTPLTVLRSRPLLRKTSNTLSYIWSWSMVAQSAGRMKELGTDGSCEPSRRLPSVAAEFLLQVLHSTRHLSRSLCPSGVPSRHLLDSKPVHQVSSGCRWQAGSETTDSHVLHRIGHFARRTTSRPGWLQ